MSRQGITETNPFVLDTSFFWSVNYIQNFGMGGARKQGCIQANGVGSCEENEWYCRNKRSIFPPNCDTILRESTSIAIPHRETKCCALQQIPRRRVSKWNILPGEQGEGSHLLRGRRCIRWPSGFWWRRSRISEYSNDEGEWNKNLWFHGGFCCSLLCRIGSEVDQGNRELNSIRFWN